MKVNLNLFYGSGLDQKVFIHASQISSMSITLSHDWCIILILINYLDFFLTTSYLDSWWCWSFSSTLNQPQMSVTQVGYIMCEIACIIKQIDVCPLQREYKKLKGHMIFNLMTMPQNFGRLSSNYHLWCPPLWLKNLEGINKRLRIRERERERFLRL